ncbi:MAG: ribonuclease D [Alphaproteobacteria bacterium]|nr:ribonuclease D [Alphaproteobacteria bacterium]
MINKDFLQIKWKIGIIMAMMITATKELIELCGRLAKHPFVTVDTEFIREKTYYPQVCLIQLASPEEAVCVDPLAKGLDLSPLFDLLQNKKVIKVFHACRQDIEIFYHLSHKIPVPVFDTQVGAMVCGYGDNVSYQQLVNDFVGVSLDKTMRVTDWSKRPLTEEQIKYALHDVVELKDVYTKMMEKICAQNRLDWLTEEMADLVDPKTYEPDPNELWKKVKVPFKKPLNLHIFARLYAWREKMAQQKDRPKKHFMKDEALVELAISMPTKPEQIDALRSFSDGYGKSTTAKEIITIIESAMKDDPATFEQPVHTKPLTTKQHNLAEILHLVLNICAENYGVAPKLVATQSDIQSFIQTGKAPFLTGWRKKVFGEAAIAVQQGKLSIIYDPDLGKPILR